MKKIYNCEPQDIINDPEITVAFLSGFSRKDRLSLIALTVIYNCKDKFPITNDIEKLKKAGKNSQDKVFEYIDEQLDFVRDTLKRSYKDIFK